ncbi:MAG: STAS domain-containing protein, partial [Pseudomonadota bacterium]
MGGAQTTQPQPCFALSTEADHILLRLRGDLGLSVLPAMERAVAATPSGPPINVDLTEAHRIDTSVAWFILKLRDQARDAG